MSVPEPARDPAIITSWRSLWSYRALFAIVLLAIPLRIWWMVAKTPVISLDGSEYVRMAENLAAGHGLVGNFEGPETMYTPLSSLLIAAFHLLLRNSELAGQLVSLISGTALIFPVFLIALRMYGTRVAHISATLIALHPVLIALAGSIYNENVYLPLLLTAVYFGMEALEHRRSLDFVLLGLFLGLAYLTRPEAFAYPAFFAFATWCGVLVADIPWRRALLGSALILASFAIVAAPYVAFLYKHTGHLRLEGKWNINYTIANRLRQGMNDDQAAYGLDSSGNIAGPLLDPFRFAVYTPYPHRLKDKLATLWAMTLYNRHEIGHLLLDHSLGSPVVLLAAVLGFFRRFWTRRRLFHESIMICMVLSVLFLMVTASHLEIRYIFPMLAIGIPWVAKGVDELGDWTRGTTSSLKWNALPSPALAGTASQVTLFLLVILLAFHSTKSEWLFKIEQKENIDLKQAGLWLGDHGATNKRVSCWATVTTYYAKATLIGLPYASSAQTLSYFEAKHIDFILLDARSGSSFPETQQWLKEGIKDPRAHLIYDTGRGTSEEIAIYTWKSSAPGI
jgi:4-amino-4-deoxy-L-arabinose transferase-like glycosyltransferase